ncbi:MAG: hypothetical protein KDD65_02980 [Bacteroidetes bacterium]|nr:hypothetical protein [Bacteroidota bacterium]
MGTERLPNEVQSGGRPVRNLISKKKPTYPLSDYFKTYLVRYGRLKDRGVRYQDLMRYDKEIPLYDELGNDTFWSTVFYPPAEQREIHDNLRETYAILKADGDLDAVKHLYIDRVDLCLYGNTLPLRVRIVNSLNDNFDYFYVKKIDANRIYGLELEHILSPSRINYYILADTLIEEHIIGIPADTFIRDSMPTNTFDQVRLAKEFAKFNERCFVRLLGDMHTGNFVIDIRRDFEKWHYQMRPIDFDQQSHHWRKQVYLPAFYTQNGPFIKIGIEHLDPDNVIQYQKEERAMIANRVRVSHGRYNALVEVMREDLISSDTYVERLRSQLAKHYDDDRFNYCETMGDMVHLSIHRILDHSKPATPNWTSVDVV